MNEIFTIVKKELYKYWLNKRTLFTVVLLPALLIFVIYTLMGEVMSDQLTDKENAIAIYTVDAPDAFTETLKSAGLNVKSVTDLNEAKKEAAGGEAVGAVFSENDGKININLIYNSDNTKTMTVVSNVKAVIDATAVSLAGITVTSENLSESSEDPGSMMIVMMLPFLILIMLFSSGMSLATESIAGERERGTFATLMMTPVRRTSIAYGKLFSLSIMSLFVGIANFAAIAASLPSLMNVAGDEELDFSISISTGGMAVLLADILLIVLPMMAIMTLISCLAKSQKEAGTMLTPFMLAASFIGLSTMFGGTKEPALSRFAIPFYNNILLMNGTLTGNVNVYGLIITGAVNIALTVICVLAIGRMFKSEKFIFLS